MQLLSLTKEQILNGIVSPFVKILSYALSLIPDKDLVKEVVADVQLAVGQLNVETPPTAQEAVYAGISIGETIADTTPTQTDDLLVDAAQVGADFVFKRGSGWSTIISLFKLRKKAKQETKAEETATPAPEGEE